MTLTVCSSLKNGRCAKKNSTCVRVFISSLQRCAESGTLLVFFLEKTELEVD